MLIEVQGTAEDAPIERREHDALVDLAIDGVKRLAMLQRAALSTAGVELSRLMAG